MGAFCCWITRGEGSVLPFAIICTVEVDVFFLGPTVNGGEWGRVLDFFTGFSYIGSNGEQTISSAQFMADINFLSSNRRDSLLTMLSKNQ